MALKVLDDDGNWGDAPKDPRKNLDGKRPVPGTQNIGVSTVPQGKGAGIGVGSTLDERLYIECRARGDTQVAAAAMATTDGETDRDVLGRRAKNLEDKPHVFRAIQMRRLRPISIVRKAWKRALVRTADIIDHPDSTNQDTLMAATIIGKAAGAFVEHKEVNLTHQIVFRTMVSALPEGRLEEMALASGGAQFSLPRGEAEGSLPQPSDPAADPVAQSGALGSLPAPSGAAGRGVLSAP